MSWSSVNYFYDFATTNTGVGPKAKTFSLRYNCPSSMINYNIGDFIQVKYDDDSDGYDHTLSHHRHNWFNFNKLISICYRSFWL